jgi:hypothetical protein
LLARGKHSSLLSAASDTKKKVLYYCHLTVE